MPRITGYRKAHFNAAHRLHKQDWTDEKNKKVFGKCNNSYFHGHNYEIIVAVTGDIDPETGFVFDLGILKNLIKFQVFGVYSGNFSINKLLLLKNFNCII